MRALILTLALAAASFSTQAWAQAPGCEIETESVEFGQYDVFDASAAETVGRITIRCLGAGGPAPLRVTLSEGASGDFQQRTLLSSNGVLRYNLYVDTARRRIAGNGLGGTFPLVTVTRAAFTRFARFHIYAAIPPRQMARPGVYGDTVLVVIEF